MISVICGVFLIYLWTSNNLDPLQGTPLDPHTLSLVVDINILPLRSCHHPFSLFHLLENNFIHFPPSSDMFWYDTILTRFLWRWYSLRLWCHNIRCKKFDYVLGIKPQSNCFCGVLSQFLRGSSGKPNELVISVSKDFQVAISFSYATTQAHLCFLHHIIFSYRWIVVW